MAAWMLICKRISCGGRLGWRIVLGDWHHGLPSVVHHSKNLAVIAKRVKVARVSGDLNNSPRHTISSCTGLATIFALMRRADGRQWRYGRRFGS